MTFTRGVAVFVLLLYIFLWVLAVNAVSSLIPLLAVPAVLAVLVAFGVWLNRFMGITPRRQHFEDPSPRGATDVVVSADTDDPTTVVGELDESGARDAPESGDAAESPDTAQ